MLLPDICSPKLPIMVMATSNVAWGCHEMRQRHQHAAAKNAEWPAWPAFAGTIVATNATLFVHALVKLSAAAAEHQQEDR